VEETSEASGVDAERELDEELKKKMTATGAEGVCSVVEGRTGRQAN
jgi:hypothetical protein